MNPYKQILMNSHASESDNFKKSDRELLDELRLAVCKQLNIADVVVPKGTLCQHDRKVTNRICDDCGSVITYVPDEDLA
tara:strand:+ start:58 stop:294 length:237 start_codon:yes stop_codon:yes gene_type:complete